MEFIATERTRSITRITLVAGLIGLLSIGILAQRTKPADAAELAEITRRGRALAEYDQAAWHSTDAVRALGPKKGTVAGFIGRKTNGVWTVVYGRLSDAGDSYWIFYEALQQTSPKEFKVTHYEKPKEDKDYFLKASRAMESAKNAFVPAAERPYNVAVIPAAENKFYVYFVPAQTQHGIFPLGGDVRFTVGGDGKIAETRQMHKSIIEFRVPQDMKPESGIHTAVLDDAPEDTDVFHVLAREPKVPELVVTSKYIYQVDVDGTIRYLMTTEAFKKIGSKRPTSKSP